MSIRNLKDGSKKPWLCECYPQGREGKRVRKRFATKGEATAYETFIMREVDDKPWLGSKPDHRRLNEIIELWFQLHGKNLKSGENARYRMMLISTELNNPIASLLTSNDLAHYRAARVNKGRGRENREMAISSNNGDLGLLKSMFNRLIALKEWHNPNPVLGIEPIKKSQSELTFLRDEQILRLFETIKQSWIEDQLRLIYKICLATGARINEAVFLRGEHVFGNKITFVNTKGKRNRTIPISEELFAEINPTTSGRLFSCGYGVAHKWIDKALPELPDGQATHVLRHTFATAFMRNGGNILDLKAALGHVKIEQTMIYAHFSPDHLSTVVKLNPISHLKL
ncbi:phage integrase [Vibrio vulnificus]|uniref:phage integrase n=1 Tax=Vibrio vulnificus TaxID=672 RepID=UPI0010294A20|nr:tyrosine-type recombinase/integrase [Vibrio vulnificus]EGQ9310795.1 tyrosine-type recombinase/integrase [Vibrio vulnificus]EGR7975473.1 tyrosine-type recombinase/integrase [Vibrio vulnificus]EJN6711929.1 tyrosine-type recombinase/integrase [Vibrio vulnificus]EJU9864747.1 tyrosine-type recombinase/integrase [Vibrio vulnificus]MCA3964665.1 tyrosine-type recombinase/integrase [Vibrio vulnificus]